MRLPKPLYESVPWAYVAAGLAALGVGYRLRTGAPATLVSLAGFGSIIGGIAIWLRRRDYRASRADYTRNDEQ